MAQVTRGLRAVLSVPAVYRLLQDALGSAGRRRFFAEHVAVPPGGRLLDVGCGPGGTLAYLDDDVEYVGIDLSDAYVQAARRRHDGRGVFVAGDVGDLPRLVDGRFDVVLAKGLLHHLDDDEVIRLFAALRGALADGGRLVTLDPCFASGQSPVARWLARRDRGRNVRSDDAYLALARAAFPTVRHRVRHDLLRVPYTHLVMECSLEAP